mgnify:CR=1 FL=1
MSHLVTFSSTGELLSLDSFYIGPSHEKYLQFCECLEPRWDNVCDELVSILEDEKLPESLAYSTHSTLQPTFALAGKTLLETNIIDPEMQEDVFDGAFLYENQVFFSKLTLGSIIRVICESNLESKTHNFESIYRICLDIEEFPLDERIVNIERVKVLSRPSRLC